MLKYKIGVIIPTRGNRKQFLDFALNRLSKQTLQPDEIFIINDAPKNNDKDITYRYKQGLIRARNRKCDIVFFIEDDDWYALDYLEWMYSKWIENGIPPLFGINETYYFHIKIKKCHYIKHENRSSAFCMAVDPSYILSQKLPADNYPFLDLYLWKNNIGVSISNEKIRAIGIKHGIGMVGGGGHNINFKWNMVKSNEWFINILDEESLTFYNKIIWK